MTQFVDCFILASSTLILTDFILTLVRRLPKRSIADLCAPNIDLTELWMLLLGVASQTMIAKLVRLNFKAFCICLAYVLAFDVHQCLLIAANSTEEKPCWRGVSFIPARKEFSDLFINWEVPAEMLEEKEISIALCNILLCFKCVKICTNQSFLKLIVESRVCLLITFRSRSSRLCVWWSRCRRCVLKNI